MRSIFLWNLRPRQFWYWWNGCSYGFLGEIFRISLCFFFGLSVISWWNVLVLSVRFYGFFGDIYDLIGNLLFNFSLNFVDLFSILCRFFSDFLGFSLVFFSSVKFIGPPIFLKSHSRQCFIAQHCLSMHEKHYRKKTLFWSKLGHNCILFPIWSTPFWTNSIWTNLTLTSSIWTTPIWTNSIWTYLNWIWTKPIWTSGGL